MSSSSNSRNKRAKVGDHFGPQGDMRLYHLLTRCNKSNNEAVAVDILDYIKLKPSAVQEKLGNQFPLFIALGADATFDVVNALYRAFPQAIKEVCNRETALLCACRHNAPYKVVSLLLDEYPEAISKRDGRGRTPLHAACTHHESLEVISLILERYPEAAMIKSNIDKGLPLHHFFREIWQKVSSGSMPESFIMEVVSLLLKSNPAAAEVADTNKMTPLHLLCLFCPSFRAMSLLLEKHPQASKVQDMSGATPLYHVCFNNRPIHWLTLLLEKDPSAVNIKNNWNSLPIDIWRGHGDGKMILNNISCLVNNTVDLQSATQIIEDFSGIRWQGGVALALDLYAPAFGSFEDMHLSIIPNVLSVMSSRCKMLSVWNMLVGRQDILNIS